MNAYVQSCNFTIARLFIDSHKYINIYLCEVIETFKILLQKHVDNHSIEYKIQVVAYY